MQRDCALLDAAEGGHLACRAYSWDGPWVSLGHQQVGERDLLDPFLVPWVKRPTGGKAVLHGHDATVGMAVPLRLLSQLVETDAATLARSVKRVYRALVEPLVLALRDCGLPAELAENTRFSGRGSPSADCFAHVSPNDVVHEATGQKVCGCALRLTSSAVLMQASIPNGAPLVDPQKLFAVPQPASHTRWNECAFPMAFEQRVRVWARL